MNSMLNDDNISIDLVEGGRTIRQGDHFSIAVTPRNSRGEVLDLAGKLIEVALLDRTGIVYETTAEFDTSISAVRFSVTENIGHGKMRMEFTATDPGDPAYRRKFPARDYDGRLEINFSSDSLEYVGVRMVTVEQLRKEQQDAQDNHKTEVDQKIETFKLESGLLKQQFNEAMGALTQDSEVVSARVGYNSLGEKLDDFTGKLAETGQRIDTAIFEAGDGTVPAELTDIRVLDGKIFTTAGQAIRALSSGDAIAEKAIKPSAMAIVEQGNNKYNERTSTPGIRIDLSGEIIESATHVVSDVIPIKPNTSYPKTHTVRVNFYNHLGVRTRTLGFSTTSPITSLDNEYGMRIEISASNSPAFMLNEGSEILPYEPHMNFLQGSDRFPLTLKNVNGMDSKTGTILIQGDTEDDIQSAFDSANGEVVVFRSGVTYNLTKPLTVSPKKVRGIMGNNATLIVASDFEAIQVVGNLPETASANPSSFGEDMYDEMNMFIEKLRVTCNKSMAEENDFVGTALSIDKTLSINVYDCHFFKLKNAVVFKNRNRNTILANNNFFYLTGAGVLFDETSNHHQINMTGNHISYFRKGIRFMPGSQTFNFQFVGNDLECSTTPQLVEHIILCENVVMLEGFQVSGNTIEDHGNCINPLFVFDTTYRTLKQIHFIGNDLGNAVIGVFKFNAGDQIVIANNSCDGTTGMFVHFELTDNLTGTQIKDNTIRDVELFKLETITSGKYVENIDISGNIVKNSRSLPTLSLNGSDIRESRFNNNQVQVHSAHGDIEKPIFHVTGGTFRNSTIKGNNLRGVARAKHALVFDTQMSEAVFITENIGYQTVDEKFVLPAGGGNKVIRDNV